MSESKPDPAIQNEPSEALRADARRLEAEAVSHLIEELRELATIMKPDDSADLIARSADLLEVLLPRLLHQLVVVRDDGVGCDEHA